MKKRILAVVAAAVMVISSTVMTFADTTTGLIGQYNFDGSLKNEVTGNNATVVSNTLTEELGDVKEEFSNGVSDKAIFINGINTKMGLDISESAPDTNTFTFSYDAYYISHGNCTPTLCLATSMDANMEQWASFGWGWQANLTFAAGIWVHNQLEKTPAEWMDIWQTGGTPDLVDAEGLWAGWRNITYVVDAGTVTIYIDGEPIELGALAGGAATDAATTALIDFVTADTKLYLGANNWSADLPINGSIDNLYIYDRALTQDDVKELIAGRDYDAATAPEVQTPTTTKSQGALADPNKAPYLEPAETPAATTNNGGNPGLFIGIGVAVVVVIVIVVVVAVVAGKKKSNDDDDDEE